jgi:hypothetical protein
MIETAVNPVLINTSTEFGVTREKTERAPGKRDRKNSHANRYFHRICLTVPLYYELGFLDFLLYDGLRQKSSPSLSGEPAAATQKAA